MAIVLRQTGTAVAVTAVNSPYNIQIPIEVTRALGDVVNLSSRAYGIISVDQIVNLSVSYSYDGTTYLDRGTVDVLCANAPYVFDFACIGVAMRVTLTRVSANFNVTFYVSTR